MRLRQAWWIVIFPISQTMLTRQYSGTHWDWCSHQQTQTLLHRSCRFRCSLGRQCVFLLTEVRHDSCQMDYSETRWKGTHWMRLRMCFQPRFEWKFHIRVPEYLTGCESLALRADRGCVFHQRPLQDQSWCFVQRSQSQSLENRLSRQRWPDIAWT